MKNGQATPGPRETGMARTNAMDRLFMKYIVAGGFKAIWHIAAASVVQIRGNLANR